MGTAACLCVISGLMGEFTGVHAQTVYRCGAHYSSHANCDEGLATPLALTDRTTPTRDAVAPLAQQMQSEADRLEKTRQREANAWAKLPTITHRAAKTGIQKEKPLNERLDEHKKKKRKKSAPASPYFTAKGTAESHKPSRD